MDRETILVTVKAYPTLSRKHAELVCTAGVREDGTWVRIYPVPFRFLGEGDRYSKFQWVTLPLVKRSGDFRPESYSLGDLDLLELGDKVGTANNWQARREIILDRGVVWRDRAKLVAAAKNDGVSLATFKPTKFHEFVVEPCDREWDPDKLQHVETMLGQRSLFEEEKPGARSFEIVRKVPYKFSYRFEDCEGVESTLQIIDWEIGALYWNCLYRAEGHEATALQKVREKYEGEFFKKDLHLFLGTTLAYHNIAPNPFLIVGVFPAPPVEQPSLL
ncbi:MAG: hypothetical protein IH945_01470 [Armatimonadetes bacterium]|nr:hypothetical protein [Armatimonadota bacterium]